MALSISSNQAASRAAEQLSKNTRLLQKSMNRLSTGKKVSSPIDDPGSLAVSMKLQASINRLAGAMKLDLAFAESMGSLIVEGVHKPFRALACALNQASVRVGMKKEKADRQA